MQKNITTNKAKGSKRGATGFLVAMIILGLSMLIGVYFSGNLFDTKNRTVENGVITDTILSIDSGKTVTFTGDDYLNLNHALQSKAGSTQSLPENADYMRDNLKFNSTITISEPNPDPNAPAVFQELCESLSSHPSIVSAVGGDGTTPCAITLK